MGRGIANSLVLAVLALAASAALSGCKPESLVSTGDEVEVGRQAAAEVEAQYPVSRDPALNQLVNGIGQEILRYANPRPGIQYTFKVLNVNDINAFSLPGGWVYVDRGLIDTARGNTDELAGVIAHEIGHVQLRHHAEMMGRSEIYGIAIGTLTKGNTAKWASVFANLNLLRWSRKEEYEADRAAIDYTYPSRFNPQGLIDFLKMVQSKQGDSRTLAFLRTHPLTGDRIQRDQAYLDAKRAGGRY